MPIIACPDCRKEISDAAPSCPGCGRPIAKAANQSHNLNMQTYIATHSKSQLAGIFLTLFLGPLGLFYASWVAALVLCGIAVVSAATIIIPILCWPIAVVLSIAMVADHNDKVKAAANMSWQK